MTQRKSSHTVLQAQNQPHDRLQSVMIHHRHFVMQHSWTDLPKGRFCCNIFLSLANTHLKNVYAEMQNPYGRKIYEQEQTRVLMFTDSICKTHVDSAFRCDGFHIYFSTKKKMMLESSFGFLQGMFCNGRVASI